MIYQTVCHLLLYIYLIAVVLCKNRQDVVATLLSVATSNSNSELRQAGDLIPTTQPDQIISLSQQEDNKLRIQARVIEAKDGACKTYSKAPGVCVEEVKCEAVLKGKYFPKICNRGRKVGVCCKIVPATRVNEPPPTRKTTTRITTKEPPTRKTTPARLITTETSTKMRTVPCGQSHFPPRSTSSTPTVDSMDYVGNGIIHPRSLFQETRSIVEGETSIEGSQPWIVAVGMKEKRGVAWVCGGALISINTVLTGAHCTRDMTLDNVRVMMGNISLDVGDVVGVEKIFVHPGWENITGWPENDLAIFKIKTSQDPRNHVAPICISSKLVLLENESGVISGWGNVYSEGPRSQVLQSAQVSIYSQDQCQSAYPFLSRGGQPPWDLLCAAGRQVGRSGLVADSCQGDSGGPLVVEWEGLWHLAGVVAGGVGCGMHEFPGVYVNVAKHLQWINHFL